MLKVVLKILNVWTDIEGRCSIIAIGNKIIWDENTPFIMPLINDHISNLKCIFVNAKTSIVCNFTTVTVTQQNSVVQKTKYFK